MIPCWQVSSSYSTVISSSTGLGDRAASAHKVVSVISASLAKSSPSPSSKTSHTVFHCLVGGSWNKPTETWPHKLLSPLLLARKMSNSHPDLSWLFALLQLLCSKAPRQFKVPILQIAEAILAKRSDTRQGPALQPLMLCTASSIYKRRHPRCLTPGKLDWKNSNRGPYRGGEVGGPGGTGCL